MLRLVAALNGKILSEKRYVQFSGVCRALGVLPQHAVVDRFSSWLVGFFDAAGRIHFVPPANTPVLVITHRDRIVLEQLRAQWGGRLHYSAPLGSCQ